MKRLPLILFSCLVMVAAFAHPASTLDPPHDVYECADCHTPHHAPGGTLTVREGNANLCQKCHVDPGDASAKHLEDEYQALPRWGLPPGVSPTGNSHRYSSGVSGHAEAVATVGDGTVESAGSYSGTAFKTYTITIATGGNVGTATFNWTDTRGCSNDVSGSPVPVTTRTTPPVDLIDTDSTDDPPEGCGDQGIDVIFTDGTSPSFSSGDVWRVYVRPDVRTPMDAVLLGRIDSTGKFMCSTCHNQHTQANLAFTGACTNDDSVCYEDNDCTGGATCNFLQFFQRIDNRSLEMCEDCHNAKVGVGSHLSLSGTGQPFENRCITCHTVHFAPTSAAYPFGDGSLLKLDGENTCYTGCHESGGAATTDINSQFNGGLNFWTQSGSNAFVNSRHNVSNADQTYVDAVLGIDCVTDPIKCGQLECANCHNPHTVTASAKLMDPDTGTAFTATYAKDNVYTRDGFNFPYEQTGGTDLDPTFVGGGPVGSIGAATPDPGNTGGDSAASGGTYSVQGDEGTWIDYLVEVGAGTPPTTITTTTTTQSGSGTSDNDSDTIVFGQDIAIGLRGVTIRFTDETPNVGTATCVTGGGCDDTAASGGSYGGATNGTYNVTVTTGGRARDAVVDCTGLDCGAGTNVCGGVGPQCAYNSAFAVGGNGVTITISDTGARDFVAGDSWDIAVDVDELVAGDKWTIRVDITTPVALPDMVEFCLTCHDGTAPGGVTLSENLVNMVTAFLDHNNNNLDAHGRGTGGSTPGNGTMKTPSLAPPLQGPWDANAGDSGVAYAALPCTYCHSGHGTDNIFHLNTQITINGIQLRVGSDNQFFDNNPVGEFSRYGSTTYTLPCMDGGTAYICGDAGTPATAAQTDHNWGAFCTFCHRMEGHSGVGEDVDCRGAHMHGGGTF